MVIKTVSEDNVGIVVKPEGMGPGDCLPSGLPVHEFIPMGHKVALSDIDPGGSIIRYGHSIGTAKQIILSGYWVNEHNLEVPNPPDLKSLSFMPNNFSADEKLEGYHFDGYKNPDGTVGTKNILGITTSVQCVAGLAEYVAQKVKVELLPKYPQVDDVVALNHAYGCGYAPDAPGASIPIRTIQNLARNPNFGGEIMVLGLGCEKLRPETLVSKDVEYPTSNSIFYMQDLQYHGFQSMVAGAMEIAEQHLEKLNRRRRVQCPASELVVGMQCGGSDSFSGITANPVAGYAADLIVRAGGTAFFSEITEVRDAAHLLIPRIQNTSVAQALIAEMEWYDEYLSQGGSDRSANPTPGNRRGGLSNVVEKALGSVAKSGTSPIVDVIGPGERIRKKGLSFAATPAGDFVCGTLQAAAGMNVHLFMTGRGSPYGLSMVPVIKIGSNSMISRRWFDLIDFDAGRLISESQSIEDLGWELFHLILDVASGKKQVACDRLNLHNDLVLFNPGPLT